MWLGLVDCMGGVVSVGYLVRVCYSRRWVCKVVCLNGGLNGVCSPLAKIVLPKRNCWVCTRLADSTFLCSVCFPINYYSLFRSKVYCCQVRVPLKLKKTGEQYLNGLNQVLIAVIGKARLRSCYCVYLFLGDSSFKRGNESYWLVWGASWVVAWYRVVASLGIRYLLNLFSHGWEPWSGLLLYEGVSALKSLQRW